MTPSETNIPYGFCHCGCGQKTRIAISSNAKRGWIKGEPLHYIHCHRRHTPEEITRIKVSMCQHGHTANGSNSRTYNTWRGMLNRCYRKTCREYRRYGGSGITVCEKWHDFVNFLKDMGERPEGKTLDRFPDPYGNYEPSNCRWATPSQQVNNARRKYFVWFHGERHSTASLARKFGMQTRTLRRRVFQYNWSIEESLARPVIIGGGKRSEYS